MKFAHRLRRLVTWRPARAADVVRIFEEVLGRTPTGEELAHWERKCLTKRALERRLLRSRPVENSPSVRAAPANEISNLTDEAFVEHVYLQVSGCFPPPGDLERTARNLRSGAIDRDSLILHHFWQAVGERIAWQHEKETLSRKPQEAREVSFPIMGTQATITSGEWRRLAKSDREPARPNTHARFPLRPRQSEVDVSVLCSLWRGGEFIERYLDNITSQTIFEDRCELIIVDAASPDREYMHIEKFVERFGGRIVYHRMPYRTGIYVAWNVAIGMARGRYLTNANLDDLRRADSLERHASALDALDHVDVVYDDHLIFADPKADLEQIARVGTVSALPLVTRCNLFQINSPHNAPTWRANLHRRIGLFDETYRSAGDYDFWIRAAIEGATFYKLNEPSVAYFMNPIGMSTAPLGPGVEEARRAQQHHGAALIPEAAREPPSAFLKRVGLDEWPQDTHGPATRYAAVQHSMRELARRHGAGRSEN